MPNWDPPEHPEERSARVRGEAYGRAHAATFAEAHKRSLVRLIETYGDHDAQEALENLRELFWAEQWTPEPEHPAPPAQALPDDRRGLGTRGGAGSSGSIDLDAVRQRKEDVLAAGEWSEEDAQQCFADRQQLLRFVDRFASELAGRERELRETWEAWTGASMRADTRESELAQERAKVADLTGALGDSEESCAALTEKLGEATAKLQKLEQDLAFERAKNEGRVTEGGGL